MRGLELWILPHAVEFVGDKRNQQKQEDYAAESATLALRTQTGIGLRLLAVLGRQGCFSILVEEPT